LLARWKKNSNSKQQFQLRIARHSSVAAQPQARHQLQGDQTAGRASCKRQAIMLTAYLLALQALTQTSLYMNFT